MFTGIIQDLGKVVDVVITEHSRSLGIYTTLDIVHLSLGASISCNGCCLTIVKLVNNVFYVDIGPKTLALSNFSKIKLGDRINLEPALRMGDPLGGHQVSGHVDCLAQLSSFIKTDDQFFKMSLLIENNFAKFIIPKGSLALCGISLTIAEIYAVSNNFTAVELMIIPHTFYQTNLQFIPIKISIDNVFLEVEFDQFTKTIASLFDRMIFNPSLLDGAKG